MRLPLSWLDSNTFRLVLVVGLLIHVFAITRPVLVPPYSGIVTLTSAALVFIASIDRGYIVRNNVLGYIAAWLGERSYSLHLTHLLAFFSARECYFRLFQQQPETFSQLAMLVCIALALTMALTEVSFRYIEMPCRIKGRALTQHKRAYAFVIDKTYASNLKI